MRINKFLTQANFCSRREADRLIIAGQVKINGRRAELGDQVKTLDQVFVGRQLIELEQAPKLYLMFNKPVGVICTADKQARRNIINAVNSPERVYPIGRLDVNTAGLILLTNDGDLVNQILKAEHQVEKEYLVEVANKITPRFLETLQRGVNIGGQRKTLPAQVRKINDHCLSLTIKEGRKRQVRRMCESLGNEVTALTRVRIGRLTLGNLRSGQSKRLAKEKIRDLFLRPKT